MKRQEKGRGKLDIRVLFTLAAIAEILGTLLIATLLTALLENLLHEAIEVHPLVWLLLFGTTIGLTAATVVNVLLLRPVVRLSRAMKQVASGNFAVRLTTNSVSMKLRTAMTASTGWWRRWAKRRRCKPTLCRTYRMKSKPL